MKVDQNSYEFIREAISCTEIYQNAPAKTDLTDAALVIDVCTAQDHRRVAGLKFHLPFPNPIIPVPASRVISFSLSFVAVMP